MHLDLPTLLAVEAFVAAASAAMIIVGCPRRQGTRGCLWWALGGISTAGALLLVVAGGDAASTFLPLANLLFALSPALYWTGARVFAGRGVSYPLMLAGLAVIALLQFAPGLQVSAEWQMAASLAIIVVYLLSGALELVLSRERMWAGWILAALLGLHGVLFVAGAAEATAGTLKAMELPALDTWFGIVHFESIVFAIGSAVFVIAFIREQGEAQQRRVAEVDALTGVSTRRAFLVAMGDALERSRAGALPASVVVFDLDHFKSVNDNHGHLVGDRVLRLFADTVRGVLRRDDRIGRIGGEEFALLLPETSLASALEVAERVRATFEAAATSVDGVVLDATVSAGVATSSPGSSVQSLLVAADDGLYEAKAKGRNRVEAAPRKPVPGGPASLRVA